MEAEAIEGLTQTKPNEKLAEIEDAISNIIGLHEVKLQLRKWAKGLIMDEMRRSLGIKIAAAHKNCHMAFLGNPGTGKTMVARILGTLLHRVGIIPTNKVTEVQRTDLVGKYIGTTGPKTKAKIEEAEGGILFVDEAYRLVPRGNDESSDYGKEALEEIMSVMDTGKIVVIFAGYSDPMKRVISSNDGLRRRVTKFFTFEDYNCEELAQIALFKMKQQEEDSLHYGFKLHQSCNVDGAIAKLIERETTEKQRNEMNGSIADEMLVNARESLDLRITDSECTDEDVLVTITMEDLEAGLKSISRFSQASPSNGLICRHIYDRAWSCLMH